ncbi:MAG: ZIP family metal transporter [Dehalococcoidales bacterium]|nr:ZIP family metal transporter [Dehalococcoidales bacterium]
MALTALIFGGIAGAATLAGTALVRWKQDLVTRYSHYVNSFAAGALITIALVHLIPESIELTDNALLAVLGSFIVFYLLEASVVYHACSAIHFTETCPRDIHTKGPVIFSGLFLHSLVDGVVITAGFEVSLELGLLAATGVILHELPEGITSFALLMQSMSRKTALILSIAVALATPVGAAIALGPLSGLSEAGVGIMIAIAAGSFLYVAASDLIPETHEKDILQNVTFLLTGVGLLYLLGVLFN